MKEFRGWKKAPSPLKIKYIEKWVVGNTVLDIGCGLGFYSEYIASKGLDITGVDIEKQYIPIRSNFIIAGAEKLPFMERVFDTVLLFDVLEHTSNPDDVLRDVFRVGKRRLIISVPNSDDEFLPRHNLTFKHYKDRTHKQEYTLNKIIEVLEKYGFSIVETSLENEISPIFIAEILRPKQLKRLYSIALRVMHGLKLFDLPKADIFVIADISDVKN